MLPKEKRLTRSLFATLLGERNFRNSEHFTLRFSLVDNGKAKFGVSVSKKIAKSAVVRNAVRRRVYASLPSRPSGLFLIVAKAGAQNVKGETLQQELNELFKHI